MTTERYTGNQQNISARFYTRKNIASTLSRPVSEQLCRCLQSSPRLKSLSQEELRNTVTKIRNEHQQTIQGLRSDIQSAAAAASRAPANDASAPMLAFDRSGWEHLASLSEQIALLEERIEGCEYCVVRVLSGWLAHVLSSLLIDFTSYVWPPLGGMTSGTA